MLEEGFVIYHQSGPLRRVFDEQASLYVDACFLLATVDRTNRHRESVLDLLAEWGEKRIVIGISNHVFHEVTNVLLRNSIYRMLELAFWRFNRSSYYQRKWAEIPPEEQALIGEELIARALLRITERLYPGRIKRKCEGQSGVTLNISEIVKEAKRTLSNRVGLQVFYNLAVEKFQAILLKLGELGMEVEFLESDQEVLTVAKQFMRLFQLEPTDALHLAISQKNRYDYFVTLDGDFAHNFYHKSLMESTKIYKVGA